MNKVYHARVTWYQYAFMIMVTITAVALMWQKNILPGSVMMLLLVFLIEKVIHTTYTITSGGLLVFYNGRFGRKEKIPVSEITEIEQIQTFTIGKFHLTRYVLIKRGEKYSAVLPVKESDFIAELQNRNEKIQVIKKY